MNHPPLILREPERIRETVALWRAGAHRIGFVPTMGALHEGHMRLIDEAHATCDKVVASIFVNPAQFGPNEDYAKYPRQVDKDVEQLTRHHCNLLFLPDVRHIYPEGFSTHVSVAGAMTDVLCGAHRPGHFDGVATVVSVLLNIVQPDVTFFGEKDYQQFQIIRRFHADLRLPGNICGIPTAREADGLALSSRNQYLNARERAIAPALHAELHRLRSELEKRQSANALEEAQQRLIAAGFDKIDYLEIRHGETLALLTENLAGGRIFAAAWLGNTRLIDNMEL